MNYIVSGLERSGTSLMMQILKAGGIPIAHDNSRPADYHNPNGYYELEGGKIIRALMDNAFPITEYDEKFIKITSYGLKFLPIGQYKIIYMERDIDEVVNSTKKMDDSLDTDKAKGLLEKLNRFCIQLMQNRGDINYIIINYNDILGRPWIEIKRVVSFLGLPFDMESAISIVDQRLYRNRHRG